MSCWKSTTMVRKELTIRSRNEKIVYFTFSKCLITDPFKYAGPNPTDHNWGRCVRVYALCKPQIVLLCSEEDKQALQTWIASLKTWVT